jgi:hypothetical protein
VRAHARAALAAALALAALDRVKAKTPMPNLIHNEQMKMPAAMEVSEMAAEDLKKYMD